VRSINTIVLAVLAALSVGYLLSYGHQIAQLANARLGFDVGLLDEVSVWLYREGDEAGKPSSPYRLSPHLSIIDPLDGPNWEIRVPGWIPAVVAFSILAIVIYSFPGKRKPDNQ
jgi:hypothetical protein